MESKLPQKKSSPPAPKAPAVIRPGETGVFARYGNTILTGVLLVAAGVLAFRWWARSAENARQGVLIQLETARQTTAQLRSPRMAALPPDQILAQAKLVQTTVNGALNDVITKADDAGTKGRALVVRGDLNWYLANLPELPGAATQPTLRPEVPADEVLKQSAAAYTTVTTLAGADKQSVAAARLGLAAIAENRGDWDGATQQLQAVAGETDVAVAVLAAAAKAQLAEMPTIRQAAYLAPEGGVPARPLPPTTVPTTVPATLPAGVMGPAMPATRPTTKPAK